MSVKSEIPSSVELVPVDQILTHEETDPNRVDEVAVAALRSGTIDYPVIVARMHGQFVLLDGHHRKEAAETRLYSSRIPAVVVDYDDDEVVQVDAWRPGERVTKKDVLRAAITGRPMAIKTSRHRFAFDLEPCHTKLGCLVAGPKTGARA